MSSSGARVTHTTGEPLGSCSVLAEVRHQYAGRLLMVLRDSITERVERRVAHRLERLLMARGREGTRRDVCHAGAVRAKAWRR
jgi:hypothetical protein